MADQFNRSGSKEELIELFVAVIRGAEEPGALQGPIKALMAVIDLEG